MSRRLLVIAAFGLTPAFVAGWSAQAPRDAAVRTGTASLAGIVVSAERGNPPLSRAVVVLGGGELPSFTVVADANGRFEFAGLPSGQFTLTASKTSFVTVAYGQAEPGRGSGLPIALKDGERRTGLRWALPRAGSISGRILDDAGQPMRGATVMAQRPRLVDGERQFVSCCGSTKADSNGLYRLSGLLPGDYVVSALPAIVDNFMFVPEGPLSSLGDETRRVTAEEVRWALQEAASASRPTGAPAPPVPPPGQTMSYGRSYFPGTPDPAAARVVTIGLGDDRTGIDFSLPLRPTAAIEGRVVGPDGQPMSGATYALSGDGGGGRTGGDGSFSRRNLFPGRYVVIARGRGAALWGSAAVDLNGIDVNNVVITMGPSASVSGRVEFESANTSAPAPNTAQLMLRPTSGSLPLRPAADGTFQFPVVDPGRYRMTASLAPATRGPWTLKSIMVAGVDAADMPFEVKPGQAITDVVVTFTTRQSSLGGTLLTADDLPAAGYYVLVFATDETMWVAGSRRLPPPARASTDGRFSFSALPAGSYYLAAVTSVDDALLADPAFLGALKASATTVTLSVGETRIQNLKFARPRDVR